MSHHRPELLAPAGTPQKLRTALHFGADAVYLGLERFSLRSRAGNFDLDELEWAIGYAHERRRKIYVCLNIQPFDDDLDGIEETLRALSDLGPDAVIIADPGVVELCRELAPALPIHLSTQASVTNSASARFWVNRGVARIIVARELHLDQLGELARRSGAELEVFVHGAVCIAFSGRCLLSLYWAGRDPRRGDCAQGCRWAYREIEDSRRPGEANPVEQDERGTYFFDAKDLCALPLLDQLLETGVRALKIEGRTRSRHYLGVTVDVYRRALDLLCSGDLEGFRAALPELVGELSRPGGRPFSTHFLTGSEDRLEAYLPEGHFPDGAHDFVGDVTGADEEGLIIRIQNPIRPGCRLEVRDGGLLCEVVELTELHGPDGALMTIARTGDEIWVPGRFEASPGALVRHRATRARQERA